jgi:hypothetical protein
MKSLLQFSLLLALVVAGKEVKNQARLAAAPRLQRPVHQHVESMQSFFVQHVNYKPAAAGTSVAGDYGRKTNPISLN